MTELLETLDGWFAHPMARGAVRAAVIVVVGFIIARLVKRRITSGQDGHERLLASRIVGAVILGVALAWAASELGLSIGVVLGAAGVLTIAVGFAAQTAVSNLISGLFLVVERPFKIGDIIEVGTDTGEVVTIDLMSTKLRTFDNLLVRIPNEVLLKANVKNHTFFPIRRSDVILRVEPHTDIGRATEVFLEVANAIPVCLDEPRPSIIITGFDESGIILKMMVWSDSAAHVRLKTEFQKEITRAFIDANIAVGVPQRKIVSEAA